MRKAVLPFVFILAAGLTAQTSKVWPPGYATKKGENTQSTPFTLSTYSGYKYKATRNMVLISAKSLPFKPGSVIRSVAYRRDSNSSVTYGPIKGGKLRVRIGYTTRTPETMSHKFDKNWSTIPTVVFNKSFDLPAAPKPTTPPAPFVVKIPFNTPWVYRGGNLCIDLYYSRPSATPYKYWRRDAQWLRGDMKPGSYRNLGYGCRGSNRYTPYTYPFTYTAIPGYEMFIYMYGAKKPTTPLEKFAFNWIGFSKTNYGGLTLPFDLSTIGFPTGCKLYTDIFFVQMVQLEDYRTSANYSRGYALYLIPANPLFSGITFYSQWLCNDSGVSAPLKYTVSNGIQITTGKAGRTYVGQTVWLYGAAGDMRDVGSMSYYEYNAITQFTGILR